MGKEKRIANAVYKVLKKRGKPMHYKIITPLAEKETTIKGKTPWYTVNKALNTDERFKKVSLGVFGLSEWE